MDPQPAGIAAGGASMERQARHQAPTTDSAGLQRGKDAALLAAGGIDSEASEQTPLLSRGQDSSLGQEGLEGEDVQEERGEGNNEWPGQKDFEGLPWWKQPSVIKLLIPFLLLMLAYGGIIVPKQNLVQDLICRDYYLKQASADPAFTFSPIQYGAGDNQCSNEDVETATSNFTMMCNLITGIISALTSPKLGALSDRYGRLNILLFSSVGLLVNEAITIFAATFPDTFSVNWILAGFAADGLCGSFIVGMAMGNSYASDCTPPSRRNVTFGYFYGCLFTGIAVGPLVAAFLMRVVGASILTLFYVAIFASLFFAFCLAFIIPESLSKQRQLAARKRHAAMRAESTVPWWRATLRVISTMFEPLKVLYPTGPGSSAALRRNLCVLAAIDTITFGVAMGALNVILIYMRGEFHWDSADQSLFVSSVNFSRVICLFLLLPPLVRFVRGPPPPTQNGVTVVALPQRGADALDLNIIRVAVFLDTLGYIGYSLARSPALFTLSGVVASIGGIASPTLSSALTKHIPHERTGQLLGASGLLHGLARVAAPLVFNGIFSATNHTFRQAVFVSLASAFGAAFLLTWVLRPGIYLKQANADGEEES